MVCEGLGACQLTHTVHCTLLFAVLSNYLSKVNKQLSQLKNYWKAMMTSFSIKHPTVTIAFITSYQLPSLLIMHYAMLDMVC